MREYTVWVPLGDRRKVYSPRFMMEPIIQYNIPIVQMYSKPTTWTLVLPGV